MLRVSKNFRNKKTYHSKRMIGKHPDFYKYTSDQRKPKGKDGAET